MSRGWLIAVAVAVLGALLVACGGDDDEGGGGSGGGGGGGEVNRIAVSFYSRDNPFYAQIQEGIEHEARARGVETTFSYANNDAKQQVDQLDNAITQQPDGIVLAPIDPSALVPPARRVDNAGIPLVTTGNNLAEEGQDLQIGYVGSEYRETGRTKAEFIVDQLGGEGKVGVIHLIRGLAFTEEQWAGAKEVFDQNPGIEVVGEIYAGSASAEQGLDAAQNFLSSNPDLDAIYVDNDDLALGALRGVKDRNVDMDDITVVGTNGTPDAIRAVRRGELDLTIQLCGFRQGQRSVSALVDYVENGTEPSGPTPQEQLTPENVEQKAEELKNGCTGPKEEG